MSAPAPVSGILGAVPIPSGDGGVQVCLLLGLPLHVLKDSSLLATISAYQEIVPKESPQHHCLTLTPMAQVS